MYLMSEATFGHVNAFLLNVECLVFTENTKKMLSASDLLKVYRNIRLVLTSTPGGFRQSTGSKTFKLFRKN